MKIDFNIEQLTILNKMIEQAPYFLAAPMFAHINQQLKQQQEEMDKPIEIKE